MKSHILTIAHASLLAALVAGVAAARTTVASEGLGPSDGLGGVAPTTAVAGEPHLANIRQLTFGRKNAEAYFSFDGSRLIFQSTNNWARGTALEPVTSEDAGERPLGCYQMYVLHLDTGLIRRVSTGYGATTCGYFFPGGRRVLYSSTHLQAALCPPEPARSVRYRWALHDYDIFSVRMDGQQLQRLTATPGYDAEATVSPDGKKIVFTSMRDGDLEIYTMNLDGRRVKRLTHELGYDGGAFFSPDSSRLVYRAQHPKTAEEIEAYKGLLKESLVEPGQLEIYVMNADGSDRRQVTRNGASNFAPFFHHDGRRIIFSSNVHDVSGAGEPPRRPTFHLYLVGDDGRGLERISSLGGFNSFPMFSPDGKQLVWISDRNAKERGEFNIFLADWVP